MARLLSVKLVILASLCLGLCRSAAAQYFKTSIGSYSTASTSFVDVPGGTLTWTPASTSEVWVLLFSAHLESTDTNEVRAEARYVINGTEHGVGGVQNSVSGAGASWVHFYRVTGTTGAQNVQVQLRNNCCGAATISDLQIIAFRVPPNADFRYAETEPVRTVSAASFVSVQDLTFTPPSDGNYLVLALANAREFPSSNSIGVRFVDHSGTPWPIDTNVAPREGHFDNERDAWFSMFSARVFFLDATSKTFSIEAYPGSIDGEVQYTRIMAFRTDAFDHVESAEDTANTTTTATVPPDVKSVVNTPAPPGPRDHIVIQSLILGAAGSAVESKNAGFERDDVVQTSYAHVIDVRDIQVSFGFFDAVTTAAALKIENTYSTSNGTYPVDAKESVIHVLRLASSSQACPPLQTAESASTITVTAPGHFEMQFNESAGGGIDEFFDLAADPGRTTDLAGGSTNGLSLHGNSLENGATAHNVAANDTGPKLDLLEATATRVKIRREAFYEDELSNTHWPGPKAIVDYSVYPSGRHALEWVQTSTQVVNYVVQNFDLNVHRLGAGPLSTWAPYHDSGAFPRFDGLSDFLLFENNGGVETDFLQILYVDWSTGAGHTADADSSTDFIDLGTEREVVTWRDTAGPRTIAAGASETWDSLTYFKPTSFTNHSDTAVTERRDDYRGPDPLALTNGSGWNENTADADFFNESEAAYTLDFDDTNGLTFDMDGSTTTRFSPFFKVRQWRSLHDPAVSLETTALVNDVDFRADVKPISDADFADRILLHTTLQSFAAVTTLDIGDGTGASENTMTYGSGRYGNAAEFDSSSDRIQIPLIGVDGNQHMELDRGRVEFWYQPNSVHTDGAQHYLFDVNNNGNSRVRIKKEGVAFLRPAHVRGRRRLGNRPPAARPIHELSLGGERVGSRRDGMGQRRRHGQREGVPQRCPTRSVEREQRHVHHGGGGSGRLHSSRQ